MHIPAKLMLSIAAAQALLIAAPPACAATVFAPTLVNSDAGSKTAIAQWQIQSSSKAQQVGDEISSNGYSTQGWYAVSGRATVMAGLLENGTYKDVFYSDNLRAVEEPDASGNLFVIPWWYRSEFNLADGAKGLRTLLRTNGMVASADVWVRRHPVLSSAGI